MTIISPYNIIVIIIICVTVDALREESKICQQNYPSSWTKYNEGICSHSFTTTICTNQQLTDVTIRTIQHLNKCFVQLISYHKNMLQLWQWSVTNTRTRFVAFMDPQYPIFHLNSTHVLLYIQIYIAYNENTMILSSASSNWQMCY